MEVGDIGGFGGREDIVAGMMEQAKTRLDHSAHGCQFRFQKLFVILRIYMIYVKVWSTDTSTST